MPLHRLIEPTIVFDIFVAGDESVIAHACREFVLEESLCVTVEQCRYVFCGGEEPGARVGIRYYPRYKREKPYEELHGIASRLALHLLERTFQHSVMIVGPTKTEWITKRSMP